MILKTVTTTLLVILIISFTSVAIRGRDNANFVGIASMLTAIQILAIASIWL